MILGNSIILSFFFVYAFMTWISLSFSVLSNFSLLHVERHLTSRSPNYKFVLQQVHPTQLGLGIAEVAVPKAHDALECDVSLVRLPCI